MRPSSLGSGEEEANPLGRTRSRAKRGQTQSEVIRDAISRLAEEEAAPQSAYDRLLPYIGIAEGGDPTLSENTGKRLRDVLEKRHRARRAG